MRGAGSGHRRCRLYKLAEKEIRMIPNMQTVQNFIDDLDSLKRFAEMRMQALDQKNWEI